MSVAVITAAAALTGAGAAVYSATQAGKGGGPKATPLTPAGRKVSDIGGPAVSVNKKKLRGLLASPSNLGELNVASPGLLNKTLGG